MQSSPVVWKKYASSANALARELAEGLKQIQGVEVLHPVEANAVFVELPQPLAQGLNERGWEIHDFIGGVSRLMCSWQTTEADIEELMRDVLAVQKNR